MAVNTHRRKSDREKIQTVYDWVITHFHRYESEWEGTEYYDDAKVEAVLTDEYVNVKSALANKGYVLLRGDFYYV